ncbi:aminoglycoside 6'-N-acetyltransferase [Actinomadura rubrisoli]|uniref:Aminoglycoside 6'-N-acetyltransferase n=1 Tax=Actinomadura rubrisoli TaxID=2530368 RepID=A0A4R5BKU9_9ACTN|nr:aminoglycoside 6'-N-acetyltransferase [Actinomadura rubrisoli]TDD85856.1 aminoglycoside 6'-N-acetyltransferase [Actinomadura rubrisoli]
MEIKGGRVVLRPVTDDDAGVLREIIREPEVAAWWEQVEDFGEMLAIVLGEGQVVGAIQYDEELDEDYRHASIDVFLSARHHGRGLGTDAVRSLAGWLVRERGHHRITIDPAVANGAAIRCYEKVGFKPVGVMREYERDPLTGEWRDGLLMDLLARELTR